MNGIEAIKKIAPIIYGIDGVISNKDMNAFFSCIEVLEKEITVLHALTKDEIDFLIAQCLDFIKNKEVTELTKEVMQLVHKLGLIKEKAL